MCIRDRCYLTHCRRDAGATTHCRRDAGATTHCRRDAGATALRALRGLYRLDDGVRHLAGLRLAAYVVGHDFPFADDLRYSRQHPLRRLTLADVLEQQVAGEDLRGRVDLVQARVLPVSYTHLRAHETRHELVCRLL